MENDIKAAIEFSRDISNLKELLDAISQVKTRRRNPNVGILMPQNARVEV